MRKVAVLVLNYNGLRHLGDCLESLHQQEYKDFDILLIDNNSIDGSVPFVENNYSGVKIIALDHNYGFAKAYNIAVAQYGNGYEFLLFLNNDIVATTTWLSELMLVAEAYPEAIIGSKVLFYSDKEMIYSDGGIITPIGSAFDNNFLKASANPDNAGPMDVGTVSGCCLLIGKKLFNELGGYDNDCFFGGEEVGLCWRAWLKGYRVIYAPNSVLYHKAGATWSVSFKKPLFLYYSETGRLANMIKCASWQQLWLAIPTSLGFSMARAVLFGSSSGLEALTSVLSAYLSIIRNWRRVITERSEIQRNRKVNNRYLIEHGLMVGVLGGIMEFLRLIKRRNKLSASHVWQGDERS